MLKKVVFYSVILSLSISLFHCASMSRKEKGAIIGATSGGVIGGVIGKQAGNTAVGAILGAAIGGAAGAYIGNYMDKQAAEMERDLEGAKITRVGEGIKVTFDSGILFDVNKATLKPASKESLAKLAQILNKYEDTNILLEGHTDATGSDEHNLTLSRQRAQSVSNYLASLGVNVPRLVIMGYGEDQPVADNDTETGRAQNRRVEVAIYANDKLKKAAQDKAG
ncbi:MAG: OmpA family protein [Deferribacteres bacterium]|nr:OmpA family protein [candidate division KSB1 bacterium]MCB9510467.1 OmpA family protein [Deferribacteres bacterium]